MRCNGWWFLFIQLENYMKIFSLILNLVLIFVNILSNTQFKKKLPNQEVVYQLVQYAYQKYPH